jgi:hypothetical protein
LARIQTPSIQAGPNDDKEFTSRKRKRKEKSQAPVAGSASGLSTERIVRAINGREQPSSGPLPTESVIPVRPAIPKSKRPYTSDERKQLLKWYQYKKRKGNRLTQSTQNKPSPNPSVLSQARKKVADLRVRVNGRFVSRELEEQLRKEVAMLQSSKSVKDGKFFGRFSQEPNLSVTIPAKRYSPNGRR